MDGKVLERAFATLFPFSLVVDRQLRVCASGESAALLHGDGLLGRPLAQLIDDPSPADALTFSSLEAIAGRRVIWNLRQGGGRLRGQVFPLDGERLALLVTPWFDTAEALLSFGITEGDFAPHEATFDFLFMAHARDVQAQEQRTLNERLRATIEESRRLATLEQELNRGLALAADLRVRLEKGRVADVAINHDALLPLASELPIGTPLSALPSWLEKPLAESEQTSGDVATSITHTIALGDETRTLDLRVSGDPAGNAIAVALDVTEARAEHMLLLETLEHALEAVVMADEAHRIVFANRAAAHMFSCQRVELLGEELDALCADASGTGKAVRLSTIVNGDIELRRHDGASMLCNVSTSRVKLGEKQMLTAFLEDVTDKRAAQSQIEYQASHDTLTGLANRAHFMHCLERLLDAGGQAFAVALIDMDDFKAVNDLHGHAAGDEFLCALADRLKDGVRPGDIVSRLGGDEFAIILADVTSAKEAESTLQRLLGQVCCELTIVGASFLPSASIGVVITGSGQASSDVLRHADMAMYQAKAQGKNQIALFNESLQREAIQRIELQRDLALAIDQDEIRAYYQPIVDLQTGLPVALEALARWETDDGRVIPPGHFIEVAEQSDLIVRIGETILAQALSTVRLAREQWPELRVSVNFSARHFLHTELIGQLRQALSDQSLPPSALTVELTESMLLADQSVVRERFEALRELGVRIALDDFGTGYSSLSYLDRFRFDLLKIDKSFVRGLASRTVRKELAQTIVAVGKIIGIDVVAEGIEEASEEVLLRDMACRYGQGYLYARPMPLGATLDYLRNACANATEGRIHA